VSWADKIRGTEPEALAAVQLCIANGLDVNTATERRHGASWGSPLDLAMGKSPKDPAGG